MATTLLFTGSYLTSKPSHFIDPKIPLKPNCYLKHFVQITTIGCFTVIFKDLFPPPNRPVKQPPLPLSFFFPAQLE